MGTNRLSTTLAIIDPPADISFSDLSSVVGYSSREQPITVVVPDPEKTISVHSAFNICRTFSMTSMLDDYYSHVFIIPPILVIDNPIIGLGQQFEIWNAFLIPNEIASRVDTNDAGLTNTAIVAIPFKRIEILSFTVTVDITAPIKIDALYTYTFDFGSGTLRFIASQATILDIIPEVPIKHILEYKTDILKSYNSTEARLAIRSNKPKYSIDQQYIFNTEAQIRKAKQVLFKNSHAAIVMPMWHEPFYTTASAAASQKVILADFVLSDLQSGDQIFVGTSDLVFNELHVIDVITSTQVDLVNILGNTYPANSLLYPAKTMLRNPSNKINSYPVNAAEYDLTAFSKNFISLIGTGATVNTHDSRTLLDRRPSNNDQIEENIYRRQDTIEYTGKATRTTGTSYSNVVKNLEFLINSRLELQFWKKFLDIIYGRRETFLLPSYRPDFVPFETGVSSVDVVVESSTSIEWFTATQNKYIRMVINPGAEVHYFEVTNSVDNLDGTATLTVDPVIPNLGQDTEVIEINLMPITRLADDRVIFNHYGQYSTVKIITETVEG